MNLSLKLDMEILLKFSKNNIDKRNGFFTIQETENGFELATSLDNNKTLYIRSYKPKENENILDLVDRTVKELEEDMDATVINKPNIRQYLRLFKDVRKEMKRLA